jgi:hypothetical protein
VSTRILGTKSIEHERREIQGGEKRCTIVEKYGPEGRMEGKERERQITGK